MKGCASVGVKSGRISEYSEPLGVYPRENIASFERTPDAGVSYEVTVPPTLVVLTTVFINFIP